MEKRAAVEPRPEPRWWNWDLRQGALAGLCAGFVAALWNLGAAAFAGGPAWISVKAAAYPIFGASAIEPGFSGAPVFVGAAVHLAVAAVWGALFGLAVEPFPRRFYVPLGAIWGLMAWAFMFHLALPLVGAVPLVRAIAPGEVVMAHMIFGLGLGLIYAILDVRSDDERARTADIAGALSPPQRPGR